MAMSLIDCFHCTYMKTYNWIHNQLIRITNGMIF